MRVWHRPFVAVLLAVLMSLAAVQLPPASVPSTLPGETLVQLKLYVPGTSWDGNKDAAFPVVVECNVTSKAQLANAQFSLHLPTDYSGGELEQLLKNAPPQQGINNLMLSYELKDSSGHQVDVVASDEEARLNLFRLIPGSTFEKTIVPGWKVKFASLLTIRAHLIFGGVQVAESAPVTVTIMGHRP